MREILFKGKRVDNGEWVEGYFSKCLYDHSFIETISSDGLSQQTFEVIPETVGQFTGLTDKNGVKIFEGDIDSDGFVFEFNTSMGGWFRMKNGEGFGWHAHCLKNGGTALPFEIIGNIHDNPELIK